MFETVRFLLTYDDPDGFEYAQQFPILGKGGLR
jgi:hypothetical protein